MDVREPERREREQHMSVALDCISRQWVVPAGAAHVSRLRRTWVILGANELCPDPESRVRYILGAHGRSSAGGCTVPGTELGLAR